MTAPVIVSVTPTGGGNVPWGHIALTFNEAITLGSGPMTLSTLHHDDIHLHGSNCDIQQRTVFHTGPGSLVAGATYTLRVPRALFMDLAGNMMSGDSLFTFSVLSTNVTSAADGYSSRSVEAIHPSTLPAGNATLDTLPPVLMSVYPPHQTTDVPLANVSIMLRFNESVVFNQTGILQLLNASGSVYQWQVANNNSLAVIDKGVKVMIPNGLLYAGSSYTLVVQAGIIVDMAGNQFGGTSTTFHCLAGLIDITPPTVVMVSPRNGDSIVGGFSAVSIWFSEDIEKVSGIVTIIPSSGLNKIEKDVQDVSRVRIAGSRLTIDLRTERKTMSGTYYVRFPPGVFRDLPRVNGGGNLQQGLNGTTYGFTLIPDTQTPQLSNSLPLHEVTPTYSVPQSQSIMLTFSEPMQVIAGKSIHFQPKYSSQPVTIPVSSSEVTMSGTTAIIAPNSDLMPGEVYTITMAGPPFEDRNGKKVLGLPNPFTISTRPLIVFRKDGNNFFNDTSQFINGSRLGAMATVDGSSGTSKIYLVGGRNASVPDALTGGMSSRMLNDVWKFETKRSIHCAASLEEAGPCLTDQGIVSTACFGSPPILGRVTRARLIWRPASAIGGRQCLDQNSMPKNVIGQNVGTSTEDCPCPWCITAPKDPLPTQMINITYVSMYTVVSANVGTRPLLCRKGFVPTDAFACLVEDKFIGRWREYPKCVPQDCFEPPPTVAFQQLSHLDQSCVSISPSAPLLHGQSCKLTCQPGYEPAPNASANLSPAPNASADLTVVYKNENVNLTKLQNFKKFRCMYGTYTGFDAEPDGVIDTFLPHCARRTCGEPQKIFGAAPLQCSSPNYLLNDTCVVFCKPGFRMIPVRPVPANHSELVVAADTGGNSSNKSKEGPLSGIPDEYRTIQCLVLPDPNCTDHSCSGGCLFSNKKCNTTLNGVLLDEASCNSLNGSLWCPAEPVPEQKPIFSSLPVCEARQCFGELLPDLVGQQGVLPPERDPNMYDLDLAVTPECANGYEPSKESTEQLGCLPDNPTYETTVSWQGKFDCVRMQCATQPYDPHGVFNCTALSGDSRQSVFEDACTLTCYEGYDLLPKGSSGVFTCIGNTFDGGGGIGGGVCTETQCPAPDRSATPDVATVSANCSGIVRHNEWCLATCSPKTELSQCAQWRCDMGKYIMTPVCTPIGERTRRTVRVNGTVIVWMKGIEVADIVLDPTFDRVKGKVFNSALRNELKRLQEMPKAAEDAGGQRRLSLLESFWKNVKRKAKWFLGTEQSNTRGNQLAPARVVRLLSHSASGQKYHDGQEIQIDYDQGVRDYEEADLVKKAMMDEASGFSVEFGQNLQVGLNAESNKDGWDKIEVEGIEVMRPLVFTECSILPGPGREEFEESSTALIVGVIVGVVLGVAVVGAGVYALKKKAND